MRRIVITGTALVVVAVVAATAAYAAGSFNSYTAGFTFSPAKAGSKTAPSPLGFVERLGAAGQPGSRAAPLVDIKTWLYGVVTNPGSFPTCSVAQIEAVKPLPSDKGCNPKALVATGPVHSAIGPSALSAKAAIPACNPFLHVWNGGHNTLVFFFTTDATHTCGPLHTGQTNPYPGTVKQQGGYLVTDVPLPPDVSTTVANIPNFYGSLETEALTFIKRTTKVHGKTVGLNSSVACLHGKRPWKVQYTAFYKGQRQVDTKKGSFHC